MPAGGLVHSGTGSAGSPLAAAEAESPAPPWDAEDLVLIELCAFTGGADHATLRERPRLRGITAIALVDALARLVDAGLVEVTPPYDVARYRLVP